VGGTKEREVGESREMRSLHGPGKKKSNAVSWWAVAGYSVKLISGGEYTIDIFNVLLYVIYDLACSPLLVDILAE
jgi:hypothetical protein